MAIDDNTTYGLTGAQVKDLAERIKNAGGGYSTAETNTGVTWVDGSVIYKKTIAIDTFPTQGSILSIQHGISDLSWIIEFDCTIKNPQDNIFYPLPLSTGSSFIALDISSSVVRISSNRSGFDNSTGYLTIYYTKSS